MWLWSLYFCPSSANLVHHNQPTEPLSLPTHLRGVYVPRSNIYSLPDFSLNHIGNKLEANTASIDFPVLVLVISNLSLMLQDPHLPLWCFHAHLQTTLSFHSLKWVFFFPHSSPTPTPASITTGFPNFAFSLSPNHELQWLKTRVCQNDTKLSSSTFI